MKQYIYIICLLAVALFSSCSSREKLLYLNDMNDKEEYPVIQKYEAVIQRDDKLSIVITCKDPELALAFNIPGTGGYSVQADGSVTTTASTAGSSDEKPGYQVDINGDIDFPVLGKLHVEGLTRNQLVSMIKQQLISKGLIKDPNVLVSFMNFKFTVMGEVNNVGTFTFAGDRITLLEAIAMAGDLKTTAKLDRIKVIRDYGNKRRAMYCDIRSKDVFLSPAFYIHQNDIIYVEPNTIKSDEQSQRKFNYWTTGLSAFTTVLTLLLYFNK